MLNLFELSYQTQKDIFFSDKISTDYYTIYYSKKYSNMFWNYAILSDLVSINRSITSLKEQFQKLDRAFCIYINANQVLDLRDLQLQKLKINFSESWLRYEQEYSALSDIPVRLVKTPEEWKKFINVFCEAFGGPNFYWSSFFGDCVEALETHHDNPKLMHFVAYDKNGQAAAIATLARYNNHFMLFHPATAPSYKNRLEFLDAVMNHCLQKYKALNGETLGVKIVNNAVAEEWYGKYGFKKIHTGYRLSY